MLPARYHDLRNRTVAAVDFVFAEPVRIQFKAGGDALDIEAPLRTAEQNSQSMASGRGQSWQVDIVGLAAVLHIDIARYPDLVLVKGDLVRAMARPGQPWFEVARGNRKTASRQIVYLTEG